MIAARPRNGSIGMPGVRARPTSRAATVASAFGEALSWAASASPAGAPTPAFETSMPAPTETRIEGIDATRPSPTVRIV